MQSAVLRSHVICLSVTLVDCDHIVWNSSKIISRWVNLGCSLCANPNIMGLFQWEHPEIVAQSDPPTCWFERRRHSIANCDRMVTDSATSQWRAYRKPPSLFRMVPSLTLYDLRFSLKWGFHMPPGYATGHICATGDPIHFMFGSRVYGFQGRRIEWRYFRLHQIQVGGRPPSWIISNGDISATAHSIHLYIARIARLSMR